MFKNIESGALKLPLSLSPDAKNLMVSLLVRNPENRLGAGKGDAEELKRHPWFRPIDWGVAMRRGLKTVKPPAKTISASPLPINLFAAAVKDPNHINDWSFIRPSPV